MAILMTIFAVIGAVDRVFGSKLGLGKEFEKGFLLLGQLVLSMFGMIIIAPYFAEILSPFFTFVYDALKVEPSIIPASLFANDMGGAPLAKEIAKNSQVGMYNAMIVSSMMGCTISFTIPFALGALKKEKHKELMLGLLCGIVTIPIGCLIAGVICKIAFVPLILNLLPLIIFALIITIGLLLAPNVCIKIFNVLGFIIKVIITVGLILGVFELLLGIKLIKATGDTLEAASICLNAAIVMSGAFPMLFVLSKILAKPMEILGKKLGIDKNATLGFIGSLANNVSTFEMMNDMDKKGTVLNSAFAVSASFVLADHLAFTLAFEPSYVLPMMIAKITGGISAVFFALIIYKRVGNTLQSNK